MLEMYYNPKCSKCRIADSKLQEQNIQTSKKYYLENGITKKELDVILSLGLSLKEIIRTKEEIYKKLLKTNDKPNEETLKKWIIQNPILLQRPIIIKKEKAYVARDEETLNKIIE